MYIIHGTWIPELPADFVNRGSFKIWIETDEPHRKAPGRDAHPYHLAGEELDDFFSSQLALSGTLGESVRNNRANAFFVLPTADSRPCYSAQLLKYRGEEAAAETGWQLWKVVCCELSNPLVFLKEVHYLSLAAPESILAGRDLLFWYHFSRQWCQVVLKDQYIPALKCMSAPGKGQYSFYPGWEIISPQFEELLELSVPAMPPVCTAGHPAKSSGLRFHAPAALLRHFSEHLLEELVRSTDFPQKLSKQAAGSFLAGCLTADDPRSRPRRANTELHQLWQQWRTWRNRLDHRGGQTAFSLCFRLEAASGRSPDGWLLKFLAESRRDPSLKLELAEYWKGHVDTALYDFVKGDFSREILVNLGHAARIYPRLRDGLQTDKPAGLTLGLEEAFEFLKESAWVLEDAGYKIVVPAWWTPQGRKRLTVKVKAAGSVSAPAATGSGFFSGMALINYSYELSLGGKALSEQEWQRLVKAKTPLVQIRGEWIELDRQKLSSLLDFWEHNRRPREEISLLDLLKKSETGGEDFEYEYSGELAELKLRLLEKSRLDLITKVKNFNGTLRAYQQRGTSWLYYLESLGLNPCLADDMGLGKTVEVIALLAYEAQGKGQQAPTLLIVPTSVIGNWEKEIERFAPRLRVLIHHGAGRQKEKKDFTKAVKPCQAVITSFALARRDEKLLQAVNWQRIVVDEAQNIKNPKSAQTRSINKLKAAHKIALTGTPIENRLLDLWSIFNFLNPGYLGTAAGFRKQYELPIARENDQARAVILKRLVEPFILRRLKTDKTIIRDLPEKVEQKIFCHLTQEQASLYQAVVDEVSVAIEEKTGIERKGMILATLLKLKQICNHPSQFLQDGSVFSPERSHKLSRLAEMVEEVSENGESLLVFTQFTGIGKSLENFFKRSCHLNTSYLHGGTPRKQREALISAFQDPEGEPGVFILSLKAGGVGITLTKANHVFHFDRWWNPAVENQATDRAYRIGQQKNVFVHKFIAIGTLEEKIDRMLEDKQKLSDKIISGDESWLTELDNETFKNLIKLSVTGIGA